MEKISLEHAHCLTILKEHSKIYMSASIGTNQQRYLIKLMLTSDGELSVKVTKAFWHKQKSDALMSPTKVNPIKCLLILSDCNCCTAHASPLSYVIQWCILDVKVIRQIVVDQTSQYVRMACHSKNMVAYNIAISIDDDFFLMRTCLVKNESHLCMLYTLYQHCNGEKQKHFYGIS